jgi:DNA-directed RNA polymerase specialized sigma24 family protein
MGKGNVILQQESAGAIDPDSGQNEWIDMIATYQGTEMPESRIDMGDIDALMDNALSPVQRAAIISYYVDGKSLNDIAKEENVSRQAIRQRILWGGKRLKKIVDGRKYWKNSIEPNLAHLNDKQVQAGLLYFHEGMSHEKIGKVMGCHRYTVGKHINAIKAKIGK